MLHESDDPGKKRAYGQAEHDAERERIDFAGEEANEHARDKERLGDRDGEGGPSPRDECLKRGLRLRLQPSREVRELGLEGPAPRLRENSLQRIRVRVLPPRRVPRFHRDEQLHGELAAGSGARVNPPDGASAWTGVSRVAQ